MLNMDDLLASPDERTLKRQYAKLLKVTRPDVDPVAFQRLREAYERALQRLRDGDSLVAHALPPAADEQAMALLAEFDDWKVDECWARAVAQGCAADFEQLLFQRCVNAPDRHLPLLTWGVEKRQWLTPWQQINSGGFPHQRLVHALKCALYDDLEKYLADAQPRAFFERLERACRQGWLVDLTHHQALQVQVLHLFTVQESWSPTLFQQVCQLFAWDAGAAVPIDQARWQALVRRSEQYVWLNALRDQAQQPGAAALFLMCAKPAQQAQLAATFGEADWQACEQLSAAFSTRFPDLLGLFPNHNPWFWQALVGYRPTRHGLKRATAVLATCLALGSLSSRFALGPTLLMLPLYLLGGWLMARVGQWLLTYWTVMAESLQDLDQRVSRWCVRRKWIPDRRYRVIRNGGPLVALGFVVWQWLGWLGLATYAVTGLIGVLQPARWAPAEYEYRWRRPLQAIYRIAGLSALQWLFCAVMVAVIAYIQLELPGTALTRGAWR